jgi:cytochrome c peroxidase
VTRTATAAALVLALAGASPGEAPGHHAQAVRPEDLAYVYGVGRFVPEYAPPAPGTYRLPPIDDVADHPLLGSDGRRTSLYTLTGDRIAIVAFVYTSCAEATGCPVSMGVLHHLDREIAADPTLARSVRLLTISFDPERDTPGRLAREREVHEPRTDWAFATTRDEAELAPLLDDFGQPVARLRFADGSWTGLYRHVLKLFLIDAKHQVRNVYSTGFLHPALILNDARTVLLEQSR